MEKDHKFKSGDKVEFEGNLGTCKGTIEKVLGIAWVKIKNLNQPVPTRLLTPFDKS